MTDERDGIRLTPIRACVITVSDRCSRGESEDLSGPAVERVLGEIGAGVVSRETVPDDVSRLKDALRRLCRGHDLVVTTGGTGIAPRDVTPQATAEVIDFEIPGMSEAMRRVSLEKTPHAMLSRALCGACGTALVVNLPGSPRGAEENLRVLLPTPVSYTHLTLPTILRV